MVSVRHAPPDPARPKCRRRAVGIDGAASTGYPLPVSFLFVGPGGQLEQRWIVYACLRDNVQHHLEGGSPTDAFSALHSISAALTGAEVVVSASKLRDELTRARVLLERPASELAISARTRSVIALKWPPPEVRETVLVRETGGLSALIGGSPRTLGDVFGHLLERLLAIVDGAGPDATVTVTDL